MRSDRVGRQAVMSTRREWAYQLQFLRFLAFLLMFFWHAKAWLPVWELQQNTATSVVSFFFVLSGLTAGYSAWGKEVPFTVGSYLKGIGKRLAKVYPLYFVTTVYTVSYSAIPTLLAQGDADALRPHVLQLLKNLGLVQSWWDENFFSYNGLGWFLSSLMFLFLFQQPMIRCFKAVLRRSRGSIVLAVILLGILGGTVLYNYAVRSLNLQFWAYIFPPARLGEYVGGIALGLLVKKHKNTIPKKVVLFTLLEVVALAVWVGTFFLPLNTFGARLSNWLLPNFFGLGVFAVGNGLLSRLFAAKPLHWLGDISFECYLLHSVVITVYQRSALLPEPTPITNAFSLVFCLLITIALAAVIHTAAGYRRLKNNYGVTR